MVAHQTYFKPTLIGMLIGVRLDLNRHDNVFLNLKHQKPTLKSGKTSSVCRDNDRNCQKNANSCCNIIVVMGLYKIK